MSLFKRKNYSGDYVDVTVGRIRFFELSWVIVNDGYKKSTLAKDILNNAIFIDYIEQQIVDISKKMYARLTVEDGKKIRAKTREILERHGILKPSAVQPSTPEPQISADDQRIVDAQYEQMKRQIDAMRMSGGIKR